MTIVTDRLSLEDLSRLPLDEAKTRRLDVYRLRPDRRFLMALGEQNLLVDPSRPMRLHLSWHDGFWRIEGSGRSIGAIPEVASYEDLRRLISGRGAGPGLTPGRTSAARLDEIRQECDRFESAAAIRALQSLDAIWPSSGPPDAQDAALAARAYIVLCVQGLDLLEMGDVLRGRALALRVLSESAGGAPEPADEALLAMSMGYAREAARIGSVLSPDDPVRMYVEGRTPELVRAAGDPAASPRTRYLALLSIAGRRDVNAWSKFQHDHFPDGFSLPVLRSAEAVHNFGVDAALGNSVIYASLMDQRGSEKVPNRALPPSDPGPSPAFELAVETLEHFVGISRRTYSLPSANVAQYFESNLAGIASSARGRLWDEHAARAWYRSWFYSGLFLLGRYNLDQLGSVSGTKELATYLQGSPEGPAAQFAQWYGDLSSVLSGGAVTDRHFDDLLTLTALGSPSVQRMAEVVKSEYYQKRDAWGLVGQRVASRLDARPANVAYMESIAAYPLQDMRMVERLCGDWLQHGWQDPITPINMTGHCLWFNGDTAGLSALLKNHEIDVLARAELLSRYALSPGASEQFCRRRFPEIAEESGYAEPAVQGWSLYLRTGPKDYAGARHAVESWLAHHDRSAGLIWFIFRGRLAGILSKEGRHEEAWRVIQPALESGHGSVLCWGADILVRLGRLDEAYRLGREIVDRYPDGAEGRATLADILWRMKRYSEAAFVLDPEQPGYKVDGVGFRDEVAPRFADVFAKAPDEAARSAFAALVAQGVPAHSIEYLIAALADTGRYELAFHEQSTLTVKGFRHMWDMGEQTFHASRYLEKSRGREQAVAWIQGAVPPERRELYLESFFNLRGWDLVWDAVPATEEARLSDWAWLMRAGASTVDDGVGRAHRPALLEHYRDAKAGNVEHTLGRYLAGLEPRETVVTSAKTPVDRCKAAYFFGIQDLAGGRYEAASDWYKLVYDTCGRDWGWRLSRFAWSTLNAWYVYDRNLREASEHRVW